MATQEKLLKSLEILKNLSAPNQTFDPSKRKEKIQHCHVVTEAISNSSIKIAPNFQTYLSITIEVLLQLCDDQETDVRMTAEECLNRIIRALNDGNIGKVQIELHKGIKRNGAARSLRAALKRFAQLAHFIRPHKGKPYVVNLFPTLIKVSERSEEQIHETLASGMLPIMKVLGSFASDTEIKGLLKGFLKNVTNSSAAIRRSATSSILHVCLNCRKPYVLITYVANYLLDLLIPVNDNQSSHLILGVITSLKTIMPHLNHIQNEKNTLRLHKTELISISVDKLLQIYELCLYYLASKDHNVVNAALETLNSLFQHCPIELKQILLSEKGIDRSRISLLTSSSLAALRSPSQLSVATNAPTEDLFIESELTDTLRSDIENWIDQSKLSVMNVTCAKTNELEKSISLDGKSSSLDDASLSHFETYKVPEYSSKCQSIGDNLERLTVSDNSSDKSFSYIEDDIARLPDIAIGTFLDNDIPLIYCARLLAKSFLLSGHVGGCVSDKSVRVSVKSLALTCLSSIIETYPQIFTLYLDKNHAKTRKGCSQQISDVLLYENHCDPQLRGILRQLLANFVTAVLNEMDYTQWMQKYGHEHSDKVNLDLVLNIIIQGLNDESSSCTKHTILSLKTCMEAILESSSNEFVLPVLKRLPLVALNPYWLVKVTLCDFISTLPYVTIYHITASNDFQNRILEDVLFSLLKSEDLRVRNGSANAIVRIVPHLYYQQYEPRQDTTTAKAIHYKNRYLSHLCDSDESNNLMQQHLVENTPFPFSEILETSCNRTEFALSKLVTKLFNFVLTATSNHFIFGCIETLSLLSEAYPTPLYANAWNCGKASAEHVSDVTLDSFSTCVYLLSHSVINYDLSCHLNLLRLSSNLYAGFSLSLLRPVSEVDPSSQAWEMFANAKFSKLAEHFLNHLVKLLNVFHYVLDDAFPSQPQSKAVLSNLAASPIKRRKSDLDKKLLSPNRTPEKEDKEKKDSAKLTSIGSFVHSPFYMKIYDILRQSYSNYKVTLESEASEKFLGLLKQTLRSFSVVMEVATLVEFQGIAEEILNYFRYTFVLEASATVECVQQLLKCLFGNNLATTEIDICKQQSTDDASGFYQNMIQKPYGDISTCFSSFKNVQRADCDGDSTLMGYLHRKEAKAVLAMRSSDKILANYIRIFEPMVIKSLKHYTITSDVKLQCKVLQLLNQLIQLRVNYCLLDSEQIFIGFVLKQFEYIEEGQVRFANELIKKIFQFLVQLSHSKQHSKSIITIPKIIQLCDGLTASGQSPLTHCIPALQPIVENIFLARNKLPSVDAKELETTRDVVLSMLLRLCEYHEVIDLIVLILDDSKYCSNDPEKWARWSGQVINAVLPMLRQNKIRLDKAEALVSLRKLIFVLEPSVFKPVDAVVLLLFQEELSCENWRHSHTRRLAKILIVLLILSPIKEDVLINKINELKAEFAACSVFEKFTPTADPLNVLNSVGIFNGVAPEMIFVRFLFKTISLAVGFCNDDDFLVEEVAILLMYCIYILQSGSHCKVAVYAISNTNILQLDQISNSLCKLTQRPVLTFLWCYVLTLLNYNDKSFWLKTISPNPRSVNEKIIANGCVILFSDYMNQDALTEQAAWFLDQYITRIVDLCDEDPIFEFICSVHRNRTTSRMFVDSLINTNPSSVDPVFVLKILKSVENTHPDHTGTLLKLVLPQLLLSKELSISRQVANLASRKIELLLTMSLSDVNEQLPKTDLLEIIRTMIAHGLVRKHEALASLLNKLCAQYYDVSPLEFDQKRCVDPDTIRKLEIDKNWYLKQLKGKCNNKETAKLLCQLDYDELRGFMSNEEFSKSVLKDCLRLGLEDCDKEKSALIRASVDFILQELKLISEQAPNFADVAFLSNLYQIIPAVTRYVEVLHHLPKPPPETNVALVRFGVLCLESVAHSISCKNDFNVNYITSAVRCTEAVFVEKDLCAVLEDKSHISLLCCAVNSLYKLVEYLCKQPLPLHEKYGLAAAFAENPSVGDACHQLYILVSWLHDDACLTPPGFLFRPMRNVIVSMARLSVVNSYMLIPVQVWKSGWAPELVGDYHTQVPPLPIEFLQEIDILEEFIFRITLLGWTSRQQFEETWMCLLSVMCTHFESKDSVSVQEVVHASSLAVKAITALLVQTLYFPVPGHTNVSGMIHVSRYAPIRDHVSVEKLRAIQNVLEKKYADAVCLPVTVNIFKHGNFEKRSEHYSYGQMSVKYLLLATKTVEVEDDLTSRLWQRKESVLETNGLDVNSCLQFLLDYYTVHLKNQSSTPLRFLHEIVRSTVIISDLFTDKSQFTWMLEIFLELSKTHTVDDELLHQYLIVGIAKATAVLTPDLETYETIKKLLVQYLKSSFLPSRMSCLCGLLYILEGCKLSNISIGGISDEMQVILPCAVEYVQSNLHSSNTILKQSPEHTILVWTLAFFIIESVEESHLEPSFVTSTLHAAFTVLLQQKPTNTLQIVLLKAIERLVINRKGLTKNVGKQVLSLALDRIKSENPHVSLLGTQLLLTYMYTDSSEQLEAGVSDTNPDHLVQTVEKISSIFEHIKRGHVFEVEILCHVLPQILNDFFSPSDILTKVIGEFLSPQQPHPKFLSGVVFQVFERAIEEKQLPLLQDWVVFSLSNFTQSLSVGMATWCLTCFFISASSNKWLRLFFPYVQTRVGRYEYEDRKMLCIAGSDFYKNLSNGKQKETFIENFNKIKHQLDTLFNDLLSSL